MRLLLAFLVAIGLPINKVVADQCDRFRFYDGRTVMSPGYPKEKTKYTCSAYLPFRGSRGGIHLIEMRDIQLYVTTYEDVDRCSLSFQFGAYSWPCQRIADDCIAYYNRDSCLPYIRDHYPTCKRFKTTSSKILTQVRCWAIDAYVLWEFRTRYPKGLKLDYNYITCPQETTTTTSTTTTTTTMTTTATRQTTTVTSSVTTTKMSTTIAGTTFNYSETTTATIDDPANGITDYVHIIVPSAVSFFVLLVIALIVALLVHRRKSRKNNRNERPRTSVSHTPPVSSSTPAYEYMTVVTPGWHHTEYIKRFPTSPPPLPSPREKGIATEDPGVYLQPITRKDDTQWDSVTSNSDDDDDDDDDDRKIYETPLAQAPKYTGQQDQYSDYNDIYQHEAPKNTTQQTPYGDYNDTV